MRYLLLIAMMAVPFFACDLAEDLEGEPCGVDADCWHTQHCARTPEEKTASLAGTCVAKDLACAPGQQLGCACDPADFEADCSRYAAPLREDYPAMTCEPMALRCVLATTEGTTEG